MKLPASRRLAQDTVDLIQPSFYPELPFRSAAQGDQRLWTDESGTGDAVDLALDLLAEGASLVAIVLPEPEGIIAGVDEDVAELMAEVVARALGAENAEWKGWRAHRRLWSELDRRGRQLRESASTIVRAHRAPARTACSRSENFSGSLRSTTSD